jgi:hypothetical protein
MKGGRKLYIAPPLFQISAKGNINKRYIKYERLQLQKIEARNGKLSADVV